MVFKATFYFAMIILMGWGFLFPQNKFTVFKSNSSTLARNTESGAVECTSFSETTALQYAIDRTAAVGGGVVSIAGGTYNNVALILKEKVTLDGSSVSKQSCALTKLIGNGVDPVIRTPDTYAHANGDLTHCLGIRYLNVQGNSASIAMKIFNVDIFEMTQSSVVGAAIGVFFGYNGVEPPTTSSLPGGVYCVGNRFANLGQAIRIDRSTQSWFRENWFAGGSISNTCIKVIACSKIRFFGNEFNNMIDASSVGVDIYDASNMATRDLIFMGNHHGETPGKAFDFHLQNVNSKSIMIEDNSAGTKWDYPDGVSAVNIKILGSSGYRSFAKGKATLPAGSTSVNIVHGIHTPSAERLHITATPSGGDAGRFWVGAVNTSSFHFYAPIAPSVPITIYWEASYESFAE